MNIENLQYMADYIRTVDQWEFNMDHVTKCVLGHCYRKVHAMNKDMIDNHDVIVWSMKFSGFNFINIEEDDSHWNWCFHGNWHQSDNTPEGAALRIEWLIKNGLPKNWEDQMKGNIPLCYK